MKTWKLVSGILSIILAGIVALQSMLAGLSNALSENGEVSGSIGFIIAIMILAGGIVSIVVRSKEGKGGNIALIVIFGFAALFGFTGHGSYSDLIIWSLWCLINAILAIICIVKKK